jgi:putative tryptophan/tyrosine transport system substrate-binding protein
VPELGGKWLELLKEIVPKLSRLAVVADPSTQYSLQMNEIEVAAHGLGLQLEPAEVGGPDDLQSAFSAIIAARAGAVVVLSQPTVDILRERIVTLAADNRQPDMYPNTEFVNAGGLMSYATYDADQFRRAATYVDKILKGANPADLPVEQPTTFEFVIILKAAKQIGLTITQSVLYRADKVIT